MYGLMLFMTRNISLLIFLAMLNEDKIKYSSFELCTRTELHALSRARSRDYGLNEPSISSNQNGSSRNLAEAYVRQMFAIAR